MTSGSGCLRPRGGFSIAFCVLMLTLTTGCSLRDGDRARPRTRGGGQPIVHALSEAVDDVTLTAQVPIVVVANVISKQDIALRDDPFLPPGWEQDSERTRFVTGGIAWTKWRMDVTSFIKGQTAPSIWAVLGLNEDYTVGAIGPPGGSNHVPAVGEVVQLWLLPETWFNQEHYVLVRAKRL